MEEKDKSKIQSEKSNKNVAKKKISDALMRTFQGDIKKELGEKAPEIAEKLIPGFGGKEAKKADGNNVISEESASSQEELLSEVSSSLDKNNKKSSALLHTYKSDIQELVKRRKLSLMQMAADEADKKNRLQYNNVGDYNYSKTTIPSGMIIIILSLILIGVSSLFGAYYIYVTQHTNDKQTQLPTHKSIIFAENTEFIDIMGKNARALKYELAKIRTGKYYSLGSVVNIIPTRSYVEESGKISKPVSAKDMLTAMNVVLQDKFKDIFQEEFMIGLYSKEKNIPFLILKTNLYDYAFDGMLSWENDIEHDLAPLFSPGGKYVEPVMFSGDASFTDTVVSNVVIRILRDKDENVRILYGFVDKNTLLITTDVQAFVELVERLRISK